MVFDIVSVIHLPRKSRSENCSHWRFRRFFVLPRSVPDQHLHAVVLTCTYILIRYHGCYYRNDNAGKDVQEKTPFWSTLDTLIFLLISNLCCLGSCAAVATLKQMLANNCYETFDRSVFFDLGPRTTGSRQRSKWLKFEKNDFSTLKLHENVQHGAKFNPWKFHEETRPGFKLMPIRIQHWRAVPSKKVATRRRSGAAWAFCPKTKFFFGSLWSPEGFLLPSPVYKSFNHGLESPLPSVWSYGHATWLKHCMSSILWWQKQRLRNKLKAKKS